MADVPLKTNLMRKSAFSCEACRKRKVKCNGASPSCSRCAGRGEVCVYSLTPTLSYTKQLESRVAELEEALSRVVNQQPSETGTLKGNSPASPAESSLSPSRRIRIKEEDKEHTDLTKDFEGLKVEHDGRISFHGPTSLFQLPSGVVGEVSPTLHRTQQFEARKERLINSAWRERAFEQLAAIPVSKMKLYFFYLSILTRHSTLPPFYRNPFNTFSIYIGAGYNHFSIFFIVLHLLVGFPICLLYWCGMAHCGLGDMKINGPYYSDVLLNAILSHSVRWCKAEPNIGPLLNSFDGGAQFYHNAASGVYESLKVGYAGIPTVQTLLLLSAQECGKGNRTQAWLYSGMAFRLLDDLGISIDSRKYSGSAQLTDEDIEIRNRLFWSCYFFDKMISLYFGRAPIMQNSRVSPPRMILDDTSEIEPWTPHGVVFPEGTHYPPTQAHSTSCFMKMCGLAEILNQILVYIYDPVRESTEFEFYGCVEEQAKNLSDWWEELPSYLKLVATDLPPYCPPSHIALLNCLYHTINILLHRPILCSRTKQQTHDKSHLVQCMSSATAIVSIFDLYRRTFGDSHVVLSLAYSVYTAASIFLLEIQALKHVAPWTLENLRFCISSLERVCFSNPVIKTALALVHQELRKLGIDISLTVAEARVDHQSQRQQRHSQSPSHHSPFSNHSSHVSPAPQQASPKMPVTGSSTAPVLPGYTFNPPGISIGGLPRASTPRHYPGVPSALMGTDRTGTYEITPEMFEAFSYVEPITTNMTTAFDPGWTGQS